MHEPDPLSRIDGAVAARADLIGGEDPTAFRLFNGHLEGDGRYVIDAYGATVVIYHHGEPLAEGDEAFSALVARLHERLPSVRTVILKERKSTLHDRRRGRVVSADRAEPVVDDVVREHGVRYAVDLLMRQDAGFYLDTRHLRRWLQDHGAGASVLNTFAYTGSLGVAARAGGASVLHTDRDARVLAVAKASYALNGFPVDRRDFRARDFWSFVRDMKGRAERFDVVVLDPPFFSSTTGGRVDLNRRTTQLVNKVRPLVQSGGKLVLVHNSLFVSGAELMRELDALCTGGWLRVDASIDVPEDVAGFASTRVRASVTDPAPFNHSTKIVVLEVRHR